MNRTRIFLPCLVAMCVAQSAMARAEVVSQQSDYSSLVKITGTITAQDSREFANVVRNLEDRSLTVELNSTGGDVFAAMAIGRSIRKLEGSTHIIGGKCHSSCALIFIAGVFRANLGEIGLHRPYFSSAPQDRQTIERQLPRMLAQIKEYVAEMGVTEAFYHTMVNTEPSKMAVYQLGESDTLVPSMDPLYQEIQIAYDARKYGVTTSEMRQREKDLESCFGKRLSYSCMEAIRWGLSERVYLERSKEVEPCHPSDDVLRTIPKLPRGQWKDYPLVLEIEACERKIMLGR